MTARGADDYDAAIDAAVAEAEWDDDEICQRVNLDKKDLRSGPAKSDLPEALQTANRDETVCEFCGVSYLVYSEMHEMEDRMKKAEDAMETWKDKIHRIETIEKAHDDLQQKHETLILEYKALKQQLDGSKTETARQLNEATKLAKAGNAQYIQELSDKHRKLLKVAKQIGHDAPAVRHDCWNTAKSMHDDLSQFQTETNETISQANKILSSIRFALNNYKREAAAGENATNQMQSLKSRIESLENELQSKEEQVKLRQTSIEDYQAQVVDLHEKLDRLASDRQREHQEFTERLDKTEIEWQQGLEEAKQTASNTIRQLEERAHALQSQTEILKKNLSEEKQKADQQQKLISELETQKQELKDTISQVQQQSNASILEQQQEQQHELCKVKDKLAQTELNFHQQIEMLEQEKHALSESLQQVQRERDSYRVKVQDGEAKIEAAQSAERMATARAKEIRDKSQMLQEQLLQSRTDHQTMEQKVQDLNSQINNLNERVASLTQEQEQNVVETATLRTELNSEREQRKAATEQVQQLLHSQGGGIQGMEDTLMRLTAQMKEKQSSIQHLERIVHQECLERTYLLQHVNELRVHAKLPELQMKDVTEAAQQLESVGGSEDAYKDAARLIRGSTNSIDRTTVSRQNSRPDSTTSSDLLPPIKRGDITTSEVENTSNNGMRNLWTKHAATRGASRGRRGRR